MAQISAKELIHAPVSLCCVRGNSSLMAGRGNKILVSYNQDYAAVAALTQNIVTVGKGRIATVPAKREGGTELYGGTWASRMFCAFINWLGCCMSSAEQDGGRAVNYLGFLRAQSGGDAPIYSPDHMMPPGMQPPRYMEAASRSMEMPGLSSYGAGGSSFSVYSAPSGHWASIQPWCRHPCAHGWRPL